MNSDFRPTANWPTLKQRARVLSQIRGFFDERGYVEVETPLLSHDVVVDAWIEPFAVKLNDATLYLQTSPEFAMKRLLVDGADAIYQMTRAFRQGESGPRHNPEFVILEWYRVGDSYHEQMTFTEQLVREVLPEEFGETEFARLSYDEAFERAIGTTVLAHSVRQLNELLVEHAVSVPDSVDRDNRDQLLNLLLADRIEPTLGQDRPEFLYDYPHTQSALARVRTEGSAPVAERFELYYRGIELCNGYQELTDADELSARNRTQNALRRAEGGEPLPEESRLLSAMRAGLPECSGVALGVDRLVALALGLETIDQVWAFPVARA